MRAIVCDKCGRVHLLEDDQPFVHPGGMYRVLGDRSRDTLDLCEQCMHELTGAVRRMRGEEV